MKLLSPGDSVSTTVSVSMPVEDERGAPWVKAETTTTTKVRDGESAKDARKRANKEAWGAMERLLKRLTRELGSSKD